MSAHPRDLEMRSSLDAGAFMAGVALFDDVLREAERLAFAEEDAVAAGVLLRADDRLGAPLNLYVLPALERLAQRPDLLPGFAAALGDYVGSNSQGLAPGNGAQNEGLRFDDVWVDSEPPQQAQTQPGNVVFLCPRAEASA